MAEAPTGHDGTGTVATGGPGAASYPALMGLERRSRWDYIDGQHRPLLITWTALVLVVLGWGVVAWLAVTRWHDPDVTLFAALCWLSAVLAGVAIINIARLGLRLRRLELVPTAHRVWHRYWLWLWIPPLVFAAAVVLGTNL